MDTDRDREIAHVEVQDENRKLVEEFMREKLGKRAQRMSNDSTRGAENPGGPEGANPNGSPEVPVPYA